MNAEGETASGAIAPHASPQNAEQHSWPLIAGGIVAVAGLGLFWWQFVQLWLIWTSDSLRSIGMLVIPVSLAVCRRHRKEVQRTD
jgi:hypothetical protein